jgi:hypothetical protein
MDEEWIDLPGPAEIWPAEESWYVENGFEVRTDQKANHLKALEMLVLNDPPKGWVQACVHDNNPYDLIWNQFF